MSVNVNSLKVIIVKNDALKSGTSTFPKQY
jgi:hypothetical protein